MPERSSLARMLSVLDRFSEVRPVWTVDGIAADAGFTRATAYRYVAELCDAGLLTRVARGAYALGPRIIELDRQIRIGDPLLQAGERAMQHLFRSTRCQVVFLSSLFRDRVVCVAQIARNGQLTMSYARGRPMPLFRGATSKVILANLPERRLAMIFADNPEAIRKAGLGTTRDAFSRKLREIRRLGYALTHAEVDRGVVGLAVPCFDAERSVIGSLSLVFTEEGFPERQLGALVRELRAGAEAIRAELARYAESPRGAASSRRR